MDAETTTKFKGDIVFNDGEKDILVSDLASVEEVNEALSGCVTNDKVDTYTKMWVSSESFALSSKSEPTEPLYLNPNFEYKDDHVMSSKAVKELILLTSERIDQLTKRITDLESYHKPGESTTEPYEYHYIMPDYSGKIKFTDNETEIQLQLDEETGDLVINKLSEGLIQNIIKHAFVFTDDAELEHMITFEESDQGVKVLLDSYYFDKIITNEVVHIIKYDLLQSFEIYLSRIETEGFQEIQTYGLLNDFLTYDRNLDEYELVHTDLEWSDYNIDGDNSAISLTFTTGTWKPFIDDLLLIYNEAEEPLFIITADREINENVGGYNVLINFKFCNGGLEDTSEEYDYVIIGMNYWISWIGEKYPDPSMLKVRLYRKKELM